MRKLTTLLAIGASALIFTACGGGSSSDSGSSTPPPAVEEPVPGYLVNGSQYVTVGDPQTLQVNAAGHIIFTFESGYCSFDAYDVNYNEYNVNSKESYSSNWIANNHPNPYFDPGEYNLVMQCNGGLDGTAVSIQGL